MFARDKYLVHYFSDAGVSFYRPQQKYIDLFVPCTPESVTISHSDKYSKEKENYQDMGVVNSHLFGEDFTFGHPLLEFEKNHRKTYIKKKLYKIF